MSITPYPRAGQIAINHKQLGRRAFLEIAYLATLAGVSPAFAQAHPSAAAGDAAMQLTQDWDKFFPKSNKVDHRKVTFMNRHGITLAADLYEPENARGQLAAIAIRGPFGAVNGARSTPMGRGPSPTHCPS